MIKVKSSCISAVGYESNFGDLIIEYNTGNRFAYQKVPYEMFQKLMKAESKGKFVNQFIKGKYDFRRI